MAATSSTEKQRRYRERLRFGRRMFALEAETASVCDMLEREGYLTLPESCDSAKVEVALQRWFEDRVAALNFPL